MAANIQHEYIMYLSVYSTKKDTLVSGSVAPEARSKAEA
jgi:hypothetical protein